MRNEWPHDAIDIVVYFLNVMKIQYTEQQYNALETVQYIHNRSSAVLSRMRMNWKVVPPFFCSNNMQKFLLAFPELFHRIRIWRRKLISKVLQNFQNHLMCTHIRNIYLVMLLFVLKSTCRLTITGHCCCRSVLGSLLDSKPCSNKMMIKR